MSSPKPPPLSHTKEKGEWGEIAFQAKALALGLSVAKPNGDNQPFDFIVTVQEGKMARIQVKTGWTLDQGGYHVSVFPGNRRAQEVDFYVIYIPPQDAWYVMPRAAVVASGYLMFYPHRLVTRARTEKYRNRWSLITGDPEDDTRDHGLTIHASADE